MMNKAKQKNQHLGATMLFINGTDLHTPLTFLAEE